MNSSTPSPTDQTRIDSLRSLAGVIIRGMDANFGRRFRDQWEAAGTWQAAMIEWARSCEPFGLSAIEAAFDAIKAQRMEWPPSLPVFLGLVRDALPAAAHQWYVALPKPQPDPQKALESLAAMRRAVRR
jgi:hypothetical protein